MLLSDPEFALFFCCVAHSQRLFAHPLCDAGASADDATKDNVDDTSALVDRVLRAKGSREKAKKRRGAALSLSSDTDAGWITTDWFDIVTEGSAVMAMDGPAWYVSPLFKIHFACFSLLRCSLAICYTETA